MPVYIALSRLNHKHVKIGFTSRDPAERLAELDVPVDAVLMWKNRGRELEADLHFRFDEYRHEGKEWFVVEGRLKRWLRDQRTLLPRALHIKAFGQRPSPKEGIVDTDQTKTWKIQQLETWHARLDQAARRGWIVKEHPIRLSYTNLIPGSREAALEITINGAGGGNFIQQLKINDMSKLRQYVPWDFDGTPHIGYRGSKIRISVRWPEEHWGVPKPLKGRSDIVRELKAGRWLVGDTENDSIEVIASFSNQASHWLVTGMTGQGKSVLLRNMLYQLSINDGCRLVILDGKGDLRDIEKVEGMVGPVAIKENEWICAALWIHQEMERRLALPLDEQRELSPLIIVIDEVQEVLRVLRSDKRLESMILRLFSEGRSLRIHVCACTQYPTREMLGTATVKQQTPGVISFRLKDATASAVVFGKDGPDATNLSQGECWVDSPKGEPVKVLVPAWNSEHVEVPIDEFRKGQYTIDSWDVDIPLPEAKAKGQGNNKKLDPRHVAYVLRNPGLPTKELEIALGIGNGSRARPVRQLRAIEKAFYDEYPADASEEDALAWARREDA